LFYNGKNRFDRQGPAGLTPNYHLSEPQLKALEKGNERLRNPTKALEPEIKEKLLKK